MGKKNKAEKEEQKKKQSEERAIARRKASFQDRLQIKDIINRCYLTRKGEYLTVFSIGQKAIDLMATWGGEIVEPEYTQGVSSTEFKERVRQAK